MRQIVVLFLIIAGITCSASAESPAPLKQLLTGDDSRGWEAVGRLNFAGSGMCTGALIEPDLVLTAAHCLYDSENNRLVPASEIEFQAGLRHGRAAAYRSVRSAVPHPGYNYGAEGRPQVINDLALLRLARPIDNGRVIPFETSQTPNKGDAVGVVSYAHDRADTPSLQEPCHVLARRFGSIVLSCDVDFGSSGAPVFVIEDGVARIVSVVSAKAEIGERRVALGSSLGSALDEVMEAMLTSPRNATTNVSTSERVAPDTSKSQTGAKFVKP